MTLSYNNDPNLKDELMAEMIEHIKLDRLARGTFLDTTRAKWRACSVGCTVVSRLVERSGDLDDVKDYVFDVGWHQVWAEETGLPEWLGTLNDQIFESMPKRHHLDWPLRLLETIPVGKDLTSARDAWFINILTDPRDGALSALATFCNVPYELNPDIEQSYQNIINKRNFNGILRDNVPLYATVITVFEAAYSVIELKDPRTTLLNKLANEFREFHGIRIPHRLTEDSWGWMAHRLLYHLENS